MKTTKQLITIALITLCACAKLNAYGTKIGRLNNHSFFSNFFSPVVNDDTNLILLATKNGSRVILQVSFNGSEGTSGKLQILNSSNELLREFQINLKQSPNFESINLSEYDAGTYTCILVTSTGSHISHFTIN